MLRLAFINAVRILYTDDTGADTIIVNLANNARIQWTLSDVQGIFNLGLRIPYDFFKFERPKSEPLLFGDR